jgi:hypothetical protein
MDRKLQFTISNVLLTALLISKRVFVIFKLMTLKSLRTVSVENVHTKLFTIAQFP